MTDIIVILIIISILGLAIRKVILDRKRGVTCSSCPSTGKNDCQCD